jgi:hypothetical protein
MSAKGTKGRSNTFRRLGILTIIVVGAVVGVELKWHPIDFFLSDRLGDNVPQHASCDAYPAPEEAQKALVGFPRSADVEALVSDRCGGKGGIQFQYGAHAQRSELEKVLQSRGMWEVGTGWFLQGVPVQLQNV